MPDQIDPQTAQNAYGEALKRIEEAAKNDAIKLALYDLPLTILPTEIGTCTALYFLELSHPLSSSKTKCRLETLPAEIGQLNNLTYLHLRQNNLNQLPSEIGQLTNLE